MATIQERANQWIAGSDTGLSSKTIWSVMMGVLGGGSSVPLDADDFGRCYRLLAFIPEWRHRLDEVSATFPAWIPLVREWDKLTKMYEQGDHKNLFSFMGELNREGMILDGSKIIYISTSATIKVNGDSPAPGAVPKVKTVNQG